VQFYRDWLEKRFYGELELGARVTQRLFALTLTRNDKIVDLESGERSSLSSYSLLGRSAKFASLSVLRWK